MHPIFQDPARQETLRNRTRSCDQGLDVRNFLPPIAEGEVFFLDIPFYRTRKFRGRRTRQMMERSGSFAHIEEAAVVFEVLRKFWRIAT